MGKGYFNLVFGRSRWNVLLFFLALTALFGSFAVLAYNTFNRIPADELLVDGKRYDWNTLYDDLDTEYIDDSEGVPLDELIIDAGVEDPASHQYKIIAADGYFKTVEWKDMRSGIISLEGTKDHDKMVIFEDKAKAYWVYEVVEIEVV
ncbi:MAG: hypothetical protein ACMUIE_01605 [Thermoplasmatota archaeon]